MLALDVYLHRLRAAVAAMAAALGGLDVLVFTGGVGENAPAVRERAAARPRLPRRRRRPGSQRGGRPSTARSGRPAPRVRTLVIAAREDLQIAHEVREVLGATAAGDS